ncbi:MAG: UrcA family protein [Brevundimonas sp.]|uniref:UrcA family protein n=1 Tax=Brevundimonas sp. TaxID=1871086 RepID=UPI0040347609
MPAFKTVIHIAFSTAVAAAALTAVPAIAGEGRLVRVSHIDLDLSRAGDRAELESRMQTAARAACRPGHDANPVMNRRACIADAMRRARTQLDHLMVEGRTDSARASR